MPILWLSARAKPSTSNTSNHTLVPREIVPAIGTGYPYDTRPSRWKISGLFGGLRFASYVDEFLGSFIIEADDPNAGEFVGRWAGGGGRDDIYGNQRFGSGYPNATTEGVKSRGFPFFFYPISYGEFPGYGPSYMYGHEYGGPENKYRPGGRLYYLVIQPPKSLAEGPYPEIPPMTLYVIGDKPTLDSINLAVKWLCSGGGFGGWVFAEKVRVSKPKKFKGPAEDPNGPVPEQAGVYYRGSSAALLIAGYNNTAQLVDTSLEDSPFPSLVSTPFFQCINMTIAAYTPLVIGMDAVANAASLVAAPPQMFSASFSASIALMIIIFRIFF